MATVLAVAVCGGGDHVEVVLRLDSGAIETIPIRLGDLRAAFGAEKLREVLGANLALRCRLANALTRAEIKAALEGATLKE